MKHISQSITWSLLVCGLSALLTVHAEPLDPPGRVARIAHIEGPVSFNLAGDEQWLEAGINRPLIQGDRLWVDAMARAELEFGGAALRMDGNTAVELVELDDQRLKVFIAEGQVNLRVQRLWEGQEYLLSTPTMTMLVRDPGSYRLNVSADGGVDLVVWRGRASVFGAPRELHLSEGDYLRADNLGTGNYAILTAPRPDAFDQFAFERDRRMEDSPSLRYVSEDVIGYSELDRHGRWSSHREYGSVWIPNRVVRDWAPYRHGSWVWMDAWGWTWIDDAPWGFAVSHYGRWVHVGSSWAWVPAPRRHRAVYAPALVAFVGVGYTAYSHHAPIGWYPLGPREPWIPAHRVSRSYFTRVNIYNTGLGNTTIINIYESHYYGRGHFTPIQHRHRHSRQALTLIPSDHFRRGGHVNQHRLPVTRSIGAYEEARHLSRLQPDHYSRRGAQSLVSTPTTWTGTPTRASQGFAGRGAQQGARGALGDNSSLQGSGSSASSAPARARDGLGGAGVAQRGPGAAAQARGGNEPVLWNRGDASSSGTAQPPASARQALGQRGTPDAAASGRAAAPAARSGGNEPVLWNRGDASSSGTAQPPASARQALGQRGTPDAAASGRAAAPAARSGGNEPVLWNRGDASSATAQPPTSARQALGQRGTPDAAASGRAAAPAARSGGNQPQLNRGGASSGTTLPPASARQAFRQGPAVSAPVTARPAAQAGSSTSSDRASALSSNPRTGLRSSGTAPMAATPREPATAMRSSPQRAEPAPRSQPAPARVQAAPPVAHQASPGARSSLHGGGQASNPRLQTRAPARQASPPPVFAPAPRQAPQQQSIQRSQQLRQSAAPVPQPQAVAPQRAAPRAAVQQQTAPQRAQAPVQASEPQAAPQQQTPAQTQRARGAAVQQRGRDSIR